MPYPFALPRPPALSLPRIDPRAAARAGLRALRRLGQGARRPRRRTLAAGVLALLGGGFSAHAALIALHAARPTPSAPAPAVAGFDLQDHFPGAALLYPAADLAAPAAGATGTAALPDLPLPAGAAALAGDAGVRPARPFSMAGASAEARARAQQCLATAIYYEAASESEAGQRAVAQVILNRVRHPAFPASVCGVVYQGSERAGCQFSYACDGAMARLPSRAGMAAASRYAAEALAGHVEPEVGTATHYHTYAVTPAWNRTLVMTAVIGAHFFHRWKGYWGTPAAFTQRYSGIEPFPGPRPRLPAATLIAAGAPPVPAAVAPVPDAVRPAYAASGTPLTVAAVTPPGDGLPESTILDKWQGTGQPLR